MSLSPDSLDLLSFSPSLLSVLHLLEYKDVLNCKLVNRRFLQLVQRNYHCLSKFEQVISVYPKMDESGSSELCMVVVVSYDMYFDNDVYIYITERRLRMKYTLECLPVVKYFKDTGIRSQDNKDYPYENGLNDSWKLLYENDQELEKVNILTVDYEIADIQKTMKELLEYLLINFYTERLITYDGDAGNISVYKTKIDHKMMIADILTENKMRCRHFEMIDFPGAEQYVDIINCHFPCCDWLLVYLKERSILDFLKRFPPRGRVFDIGVDYADYGQQIVDVIRTWEICDLTIWKLHICGRLNWSFQQVESAITGSFRLTFHRYFIDDLNFETLEIFIRRQVDDAVICLRYRECGSQIYSITKLNVFKLIRPLEIPLHQIGTQ